MDDRRATGFPFADFECSISTPWSDDEIELHFDDRHRAAWRDLPVSSLSTSEDDEFADPPPLDDEGNELPVTPSLRWMTLPLGRVTAERRFADGEVDTFASFELELSLEPGPWSDLRCQQVGRGTTLWSTRFERLFVRVVQSLCEAKVPPDVRLPRSTPRRCTAAALVEERWADRGAQIACNELDDYWNPGTEVDVPRLLAALEAGHTHRGTRAANDPPDAAPLLDAWAVVRHDDGSVRLITPLAIEILRVDVVAHPSPGYLTARYFLAIDLDARGQVEDVSIRAARDGTFDAETDDSPSMFAERDPDDGEHLRSRLASVAYSAITWAIDEHLREETFEDAEAG